MVGRQGRKEVMTCPNQGQNPGGRCALEPDHEGPCSFRCAAPGCPGLPYPASLRRHPCVECECHGELVPGVLWPWGVDGDDTAAVVERCDQCGRFEDDDAAAAALAAWLEEERRVQTWATTVRPFAATNREDGRAAISYGGRITDRMTADAIHALADGEPWALCRGGLHVALRTGPDTNAIMVAVPTSFGWVVSWSSVWLERGPAFSRLMDAPSGGAEVTGLRPLAGAVASARSVRDAFKRGGES